MFAKLSPGAAGKNVVSTNQRHQFLQ